tara:strand:- start:5185 stop:5901 length:717 start_codon:yes stop_codon:yes gene_type:complete
LEKINSWEETPFAQLEIPAQAQLYKRDKIFCLEKYNWDFKDCETFQIEINKIIAKNRDYKFYIFTNHSHVFTLGRGNERGQDELVDFDPTLKSQLKFPVEQIHRGGGITFHYPGQWIFYPICSISKSYTLDDHMCWILKSTGSILENDFSIQDLLIAKKLMGIWRERKKLASIGVGLKSFVSLHGLALNLNKDEKMFSELQKINPCGLDSTIYHTVESIINDQINPSNFTKSFIKSIS